MADPVRIDPATGERITSTSSVQIDPATGERVAAQPAQQGKGFGESFVETSPLGFIGSALRHPIDTVTGLPTALKQEAGRVYDQLGEAWNTPNNQPLKAVDRTLYAIPFLGAGMKQADEQAKAGNIRGAVGSGLGTMTSILTPEVARGMKAGGLIPEIRVPEGIKNVPSRIMRGSKLDEIIPGDTVTPRQRYEAAKRQGVQLDLAQATGGKVAGTAKYVSEHSLLGAGKYEALQAANREALGAHATKVLDSVAPAISREEFGTSAREALIRHQEDLKDQANVVFEQLSKDATAVKPKITGIQDKARQILAEFRPYYEKNPELMGPVAPLWRVVEGLAQPKAARVDPTWGWRSVESSPLTWSDLQKLRSDLMDRYRSSEMMGSRGEGWLKQLTGAVDEAMTDSSSGLTPEQLAEFRRANDIYSRMKDVFDNSQNPLYSVVRAKDGLQAANQLANVNPTTAAYLKENIPGIASQFQRQKMERVLSPAGNGVPEWSTLPTRFGRAQKEALGGILDPQQIQDLEDLSRTSRTVNFDSNPSGTAKTIVRVGEAGSMWKGAAKLAGGVVSGEPGMMLEGAGELSVPFANKGVAKVVTSPRVVEFAMRPAPKIKGAWMDRGSSKLKAAGVDAATIESLKGTAKGRSALFEAGNTAANSARMAYILSQVKGDDKE